MKKNDEYKNRWEFLHDMVLIYGIDDNFNKLFFSQELKEKH